MYLLQGIVVEKITGLSWEESIREKFFNAILSESAMLKCGEMESHLRKIEHRSIHETPEQKERRIVDANEAIRHILLKS